MLVIKNKTKKTQIRVFTSLCIVFGEKVVHVESLLSCVVIWFHFGLTQKKFCYNKGKLHKHTICNGNNFTFNCTYPITDHNSGMPVRGMRAK